VSVLGLQKKEQSARIGLFRFRVLRILPPAGKGDPTLHGDGSPASGAISGSVIVLTGPDTGDGTINTLFDKMRPPEA